MIKEEVVLMFEKFSDFSDGMNFGLVEIPAPGVHPRLNPTPLKGAAHSNNVIADGIAHGEMGRDDGDAIQREVRHGLIDSRIGGGDELHAGFHSLDFPVPAFADVTLKDTDESV